MTAPPDPNSSSDGRHWLPQPGTVFPLQPYRPPYIPVPAPSPITQIVQREDSILTRVRAIAEMLTAKAITRAEARRMLAALDPAFAAVLSK